MVNCSDTQVVRNAGIQAYYIIRVQVTAVFEICRKLSEEIPVVFDVSIDPSLFFLFCPDFLKS